MKRIARALLFTALMAGLAAAQARNVELAISDMDKDDHACGLRYPTVKTRVQQALAEAGVREVAQSDYGVVVIITSLKRPTYCASDLIVSLRRIVPQQESDVFRTRNRLATLELCRAGGLVASPVETHERDFLAQLERSVGVCFGQVSF